jgi:hypothetical protein
MTNQSIEDASRREFEAHFHFIDPKKTEDAWGKVTYAYSHVEAMWEGWQAARQSSQSEPVSEWLETEISAIDTWYRGSPSYERSAYWFKEQVLELIKQHKSVIDNNLSAPQQASQSEPVATADYIAYLYSDGNKLKVAEEMPPPDNAFPVFTTNIRFLDVARLVLDDNIDLILEHGGVKLWEALITKVNKDYAERNYEQ